MRQLLPLFGIACLLWSSTGCTKDQEDTGYRAANITFRQDSGYTYLNDTLPAGDTIRIGITVEEGSERLYTFLIDRKYNSDAVQHIDTMPIPSVPFYHDTLFVLRDQPGTEQWTFKAVEGNGDLTSRSLTFTTQ